MANVRCCMFPTLHSPAFPRCGGDVQERALHQEEEKEEEETPAGSGPRVAAAEICQECKELARAWSQREHGCSLSLSRRWAALAEMPPGARGGSLPAPQERERRRETPATKWSLFVGQDAPSSWTDPAYITLSLMGRLQLPFPLLCLGITGDPTPSQPGRTALPFIPVSAAGGCWALGPVSADVKLPVIAWLEAAVGPHLCSSLIPPPSVRPHLLTLLGIILVNEAQHRGEVPSLPSWPQHRVCRQREIVFPRACRAGTC